MSRLLYNFNAQRFLVVYSNRVELGFGKHTIFNFWLIRIKVNTPLKILRIKWINYFVCKIKSLYSSDIKFKPNPNYIILGNPVFIRLPLLFTG